MASVQLTNVLQTFPASTVVTAYPDPRRGFSGVPPTVAGSTGTVASGGSLSLTDLSDDTAYILYASVNGTDRYLRTSTQHSASEETDTPVLGDFGPLGSSNDTATFNAALASGRHVIVPPGTYSVTGTLTAATGSGLIGIGRPVIQIAAQRVLDISVTDVEVTGLIFRGTHTSNNYQARLQATAENCRLDIEFENANSGVECLGSYNEITVRGRELRGPVVKVGSDAHDVRIPLASVRNGAGFGVYITDTAHGVSIGEIHKWMDTDTLTAYQQTIEEVARGYIGLEALGATFNTHHCTVDLVRCLNSGDAGTSITGDHWTIGRGEYEDCELNGFSFIGSYNKLLGGYARGCRNGVGWRPSAGGLGQHNVLIAFEASGNRDFGFAHNDELYREFVAGATYPSAVAYTVNGVNIYRLVSPTGTAGSRTATFGPTAPVHTSGIVSDDRTVGGNMWEWIGAYTGGVTDADDNYMWGCFADGTNLNGIQEIAAKGSGLLWRDGKIVPTQTAGLSAYTSNGGAPRGATAVDLQQERSSSTDVASGAHSTIGGGQGNEASGDNSTVVGGADNTASGSSSTVVGGNGNVADGSYDTVRGRYATSRGAYGKQSFASGRFAAVGDAQGADHVLRAQTTDATVTRLTANGSTATTTNSIPLAVNSAFLIRGIVIATDTGTGDTKAWSFAVTLAKAATNGTTRTVGTPTLTVEGQDTAAAGWTITVAAGTTHGALAISGTGEAGKTINWVCAARSVEVVR